MRSLLLRLRRNRPRLPLLLVGEAAECGLACLAMISRFHGHCTDIAALRHMFPISITGMNLRNLMEIADRLQFSARALRIDLEALKKVKTPAIVHWDFDHFVVLKSATASSVVVHDPVKGARKLSLDEVSKHFTGVVVELEPAMAFTPLANRHRVGISSLWSRSKGITASALQVLGISVLLQCTAFIAPFYIQLVADEAIQGRDQSLLTTLALGFGILVLLQSLIAATRDWAVQVFGSLLSFQMIGNIVRHLLRLPVSYFEKRHVGDVVSRVNSTIAIQEALTKGVLSTIIDGLMAVVALVIMLLYSTTLGAIVIGAAAINIILGVAFYPALRTRTEQQLVASAEERTHILESIRASQTIKLMGREASREGSWRNLYTRTINASLLAEKLQIVLEAAQSIVTALTTIIVTYVGALYVIQGADFTVGMLLAFLSFRLTFSDRLTALLAQIAKFRLLGLHLQRLADIVTTEPDVKGAAVSSLEVAGAVALRNVSFRYGFADPLILEDIDLNIDAGEFVAIVGPSGAGKTTLLKILLGLQEPARGAVYLDQCRANPELFRSWREKVGVVSQDDRLLAGSIAENIGFFDPELDMERVEHAAMAAQVHDDIARLPMRYSSLVGDMGSALSGGQRQRVLLARALYRDPRVLVLDEGTANIDEAAEAQIANIIANMSVTRIVVAHKSELVRLADRVVDIRDLNRRHQAPATRDNLLRIGARSPVDGSPARRWRAKRGDTTRLSGRE